MTTSAKIETLTRSPEQTKAIGTRLARLLRAGSVIALYGELGSGKTVLCKGLALGLGIGDERIVTSPTFTIVHIYDTTPPLYHIDLYRIDDDEIAELALEEFFSSDGISVIEWAEKVELLLPPDHIKIFLQHIDASTRRIEIIDNRSTARITPEALHLREQNLPPG